MATILVTGGCGFIGSHFIRHLLESYPEDKIVNLDKLTYAGNQKNVRDIQDRFGSRYRFVKGDIADAKVVSKVFTKTQPDFVANLAAESHVDRSILDPQAFVATNVQGVTVLLDATRTHGVERFLCVSTDEVYGVAQAQREFQENDMLEPHSPYAASKAAGELLALAYHKTYNLPVVITRGSNAYGPYQYPEKFLPVVITNLIEGKRIPLYPPGTQVREWTHVVDHATELDRALRKGSPGEIFNFGSGERSQNIEMVRAILALFNKNEDTIEFINARPGHDARYALSSKKIRSLGWTPTYSLQDSLPALVAWYKKNEAWWKPLKSRAYLEYWRAHYHKNNA